MVIRTDATRSAWSALLLVVACLLAAPAWAQSAPPPERVVRKEAPPKRLEGITVDEHLEQKLPLNLSFTDETGKPVTLADYFDGKVPVILTLNYSNCPMLCSMQLNGVVKGMKQVDWTAGQEFRVVTVSLDPTETPERARKTKARYLTQYGRPDATDGWHFLTGSEANIRAVADAIGFRYGYNEVREEWVHPAAITVLTPDAIIARYLYGLEYHPKTLRLSLVEASQGKIGTTVDRLILYCFHYDATEGRYAPVAVNIMRVGGAVAVVLLGGFLGALWMNERRKKKRDIADRVAGRAKLDEASISP